jgi:peptide/nickel transport system permease protein
MAENSNKNNERKSNSNVTRVAKYMGGRLISLVITVVIGIYLTILIANMGGYVDELLKAQVNDRIMMSIAADKTTRNLTDDERKALIEKQTEIEYQRLGLNQPFLIRSFRFLWNAVRLDFGKAQSIYSDSGSKQVSLIISERLGPSLLLMGTSNLILFFLAISVSLALSRRYGSFLDKMFISLSPMSSMPAWFYGIFLILLFSAILKILPFSGMIDAPPPAAGLPYILSVLKHLIMPVLALVISQSFASIYSWRTFFMIYSSEDYVEMAKAKGLPSKLIKRRYILRPTLPTIMTSFSLIFITSWMGAMLTEKIFQWPGLGTVIVQAVGLYDTAVIVSTTIIYGYLLAITVFLLDFLYALVDPRVKIGSGNGGRM